MSTSVKNMPSTTARNTKKVGYCAKIENIYLANPSANLFNSMK
jgi:hypothetical protein